jgi:hypothetical protein
MVLTASKLRENVYRILDEVIETGVSVDIKRKGKTLRIVAVDQPDILANLRKRPCINGDPEDIVHLDWSGEWTG